MAKSKFLGFIEALGRLATFITVMIKYAKKYDLSDEEFGKIATDEGESLIEQFVLSLKDMPVEEPAPDAPVYNTIRNKRRVTVDRVTPLEKQFAELAKEGRIHGDWWKALNSKNFPSDMTRPTEIMLGECGFGRYYADGELVNDAIMTTKGVIRNGDPYEFAAWLRIMSNAGLEYWLSALDVLLPDVFDRNYAPTLKGAKVDCHWCNSGWVYCWFFLVVCEE